MRGEAWASRFTLHDCASGIRCPVRSAATVSAATVSATESAAVSRESASAATKPLMTAGKRIMTTMEASIVIESVMSEAIVIEIMVMVEERSVCVWVSVAVAVAVIAIPSVIVVIAALRRDDAKEERQSC